VDLKAPVPAGLTPAQEKNWKYQRYIKDYLRCVASIDDNVGRMLDFLDAEGLAQDTVVIYTSDQGFFLGDHGWFDKRFMYEESLRMPFIMRYPREIGPGGVCRDMVLNVDFAPLFLDWAGVAKPAAFQGESFRPLLCGATPPGWQQSMYYRYWMHRDGSHNAYAHYGVRTLRYKLIYYYNDPCGQPGAVGAARPPEWELFDLDSDPCELRNVHSDPAYAGVVRELTAELARLQAKVGDKPFAPAN
jgi:arylsulfatase A-like enzyme